MKKRILSLLVGVFGMFAAVQAQPPSVNDIYINGVLAAGLGAGPIALNSVITYNGQQFYIVMVPAPIGTVQPTSTGITSALAFGISGMPFTVDGTTIPGGSYTADVNGNGQFGTTDGFFTVTQFAPFDFGISAVLGAGALGAIRAARKRRKENEIASEGEIA